MKIKKFIISCIFFAALTSMLAFNANAASTCLVINGNPYTGSMYVNNGCIYVPLRSICESNGYNVDWDPASYSAIISSDSGQTSFSGKNGCIIRNSSMYAPIRVLVTALSGDIFWDGSTSTASVVLNSSSVLSTDFAFKDNAATLSAPVSAYTEDELFWLARIIYAEARGESMEGKIAVGNCILARVASDDFPDTIYNVIFDKKYAVQYEPVLNGTIYNTPDDDCYEAARRCLEGENAVINCLYFFNPRIATSNWIANNRTYVTTIGNHDFYA